jgi:hypothetical protein
MTRLRSGLLGIVLTLAGFGCSDKNKVPSSILGREDMQNVLWDMIQADQYSINYVAKDSAHINVKMENLRLYDQVFQLHHISREKFSESYKYYMAHPELTQTLLDSLLAMGNRLRAETYTHPVSRPASPPPPPVVKPDTSKKPIPLLKRPDSVKKHSSILKGKPPVA